MKVMSYAVLNPTSESSTIHFRGTPPLSPGQPDDRVPMHPARILLAALADEGYYLYRLDDRGEPAGDTWHATLAEVKEQAHLEYELRANIWQDVPGDRSDLLTAIRYFIQQLSDG